MSQNVFGYGYRTRYYLRHPIKFIKETIRNFQEGWRRATKGWAYLDAWEFGYWFLDVIPNILDYLAKHNNGYPANDRFPTLESWREHLISISNLLKNAREEVRDQKNEYYPQYEALLAERKNIIQQEKDANGNIIIKVSKPDEIVLKYLNRDRQLSDEQDVMIEEALKLLAETPLKSIWD